MVHLEAPVSFKRLVLAAALAAAALEILLFIMLWRLGVLVDPGVDRRAALAFVLLGTALTVQSMGVVGVVWLLVAMSRTTLHADLTGLSLEHPWRHWHGQWSDVSVAGHYGGWLIVELHGSFRRWYIRVDAADALDSVQRELPPGVWLAPGSLRRHLMRRALPLVLGGAGLGGLALVAVLQYLRQLR
jgi:hypothetical protein